MLFVFQDQYRVLYLALMEAFCGPPKAVRKETFLSKYHGKNSLHNDEKVSQTVNLATEFEVFIRVHKNYKCVNNARHLTICISMNADDFLKRKRKIIIILLRKYNFHFVTLLINNIEYILL